MNWKGIEGERYAIQSQCGRFRIARTCHDEYEIYSLFGRESGNWELMSNYRSPDSAKDAAAQIIGNKIKRPRDYE